jgi:hypothetical protein
VNGPSPGIITPWSFAQALEAAGLISDPAGITRITIVCEPSKPVMINVEKYADERLYSLVDPDLKPRCAQCGREGDDTSLYSWVHEGVRRWICWQAGLCVENSEE